MGIALIITDRNTDALCQRLQTHLPDVNVQQWPAITDPKAVHLAVLWDHPKGITVTLPNLKMVVSMGAGMDHIDADSNITPDILKASIVTAVLQQNMAQYVLQHVLHDHRHHQAYAKQQATKHWQVLEKEGDMPVVGFLGLGRLGGFVADRMAGLGFQIMAWTAQQQHPKHPCFHGLNGLKHVCENSRFLVVLLPLNKHTVDIIDSRTLAWCKNNTTLINVGRGGHVNETDLIEALHQGTIKRAVLDVFKQEPLPANHVFWNHPKITITPHSSSRSEVNQTAMKIIELYQSL